MDIILKTAKDAARLLNAIRAQYIIVLPTGEQIIQGDLKLHVPDDKPQRKVRTPPRHPHGFLNNHILPFLQPADVHHAIPLTAQEVLRMHAKDDVPVAAGASELHVHRLVNCAGAGAGGRGR